MWGKINIKQKYLDVQAYYWTPQQRTWTLGSDDFHPNRQVDNTNWCRFKLPSLIDRESPSKQSDEKKEKVKKKLVFQKDGNL